MKVYTRVVIDMASGELLEADSYDHSGPVALCKGGGGKQKVEETPEQRELAKISREKYRLYQDVIQPLENQYMERVDVTPGERDRAAAQVGGQAARGYEGVRQQGREAAVTRGNPLALGDAARQEAVGTGEALAGTETDLQGLQYQGLENIIAMGSGQAIDAQLGLTEVAGQRGAEAISRANTAQQERFARQGNLGSMAGMGLRLAQGMGGPEPVNVSDSGNWYDRSVGYDQPINGYRGTAGF